MRQTVFITAAMLAFAVSPALAAMGGYYPPAANGAQFSRQAPTLVASPCPPGKVPNGSTSGSSGGCEAPAGSPAAGVINQAAPSAPCPPGTAPNGSTSGSNGGCEAPAGTPDKGTIVQKAPVAPCPPGQVQNGSSSGSKGGCEAAPAK